jgi:hypothetical protein
MTIITNAKAGDVILDAVQTLTNKTLTAPTISDPTFTGTTTNINTTNLVVEDKNIVINDVTSPTDANADGGGISLNGATTKTLNWVDATDAWTSSEHLNLASGKSYYANGTLLKDVSETLTNKTLTAPIINLSINANTATTYTFVLADNGKLVTSNNASAQTLSIPTNASVAYAIGAQINVAWITGAGQPTINAVTSGTTTVLSTGATSTAPKLRRVNSVATCIKIATDTWLVTGDIE